VRDQGIAETTLAGVRPLLVPDMANRRPQHRSAGVALYVYRRNGPSGARFYDTSRWKRLRAAYLVQHPLCECGCLRPATVVDHKQPHNGDATLAFDWDNLQAMTKPCHDRKTAARDGGFGNRKHGGNDVHARPTAR